MLGTNRAIPRSYDNLFVMIGNNWDFCLKKYAMLSFLCFLIPVQVLPLPGQVLIGTGSLSHAGLLQMGPTGYVALTYGHGFPLAG